MQASRTKPAPRITEREPGSVDISASVSRFGPISARPAPDECKPLHLWVVRKGATPAFPGQRGFVGGSMGDDAVIVEGVDSEASRAALFSTVHGAGRVFSRTAAKRTFARAQMDAWLKERGVLLAGGDLDESPMAYRRLPNVLARHAGTIAVRHTLRPFAVAMAGDGEFDPFKD